MTRALRLLAEPNDDNRQRIAGYLVPNWAEIADPERRLLAFSTIAPWVTGDAWSIARGVVTAAPQGEFEPWLLGIAPRLGFEPCWSHSYRASRTARQAIWSLMTAKALSGLTTQLRAIAQSLTRSEDNETAALGLFFLTILKEPESDVAFEAALLQAMRGRPAGSIELRILLEAAAELQELGFGSARLKSAMRFFSLWGEPERGWQRFLAALEIMESDRHLSRELKALALLYRSSLELRKMRTNDSIKHATKAKVEFAVLDHQDGLAEASLVLGHAYLRKRNFQEAREYAEEARRLGRRAIAVALSADRLLSELDFLEGFSHSGIRRLEKSLTLATALGSAQLRAEVQFALGKGLAECQRYDEAITYLKDAVRFYEDNNFKLNLANALLMLGGAMMNSVPHSRRGVRASAQLSRAEEYLRRALEISADVGETTDAYVHTCLGRLLLRQAAQFNRDVFAEAQEHLAIALDAFQHAENNEGVVEAGSALAELKLEQGRLIEAAKLVVLAAASATDHDQETKLIELRALAENIVEAALQKRTADAVHSLLSDVLDD